VEIFSQKDLLTAEETSLVGIKDAKECLTVLACTNAFGMPKCKLLVTRKSKNPNAFKGPNYFLCITEVIKESGICLKYFLTGLKLVLYPKLVLSEGRSPK
jgi:hypothetical protein